MEKMKAVIERLDAESSADLAAEMLLEINFVDHSDIGKATAIVEFLLDKIEVLQDESQSKSILLDACKSANASTNIHLQAADEIVRKLADCWCSDSLTFKPDINTASLIDQAQSYVKQNPK